MNIRRPFRVSFNFLEERLQKMGTVPDNRFWDETCRMMEDTARGSENDPLTVDLLCAAFAHLERVAKAAAQQQKGA